MLRFTFRQVRMDMTMFTTRDFELVPVTPTKSTQADFTLNQALLSNGTERKSGRCSAMDIQLDEGAAFRQESKLDRRSLSLSLSLSSSPRTHGGPTPSQAVTITLRYTSSAHPSSLRPPPTRAATVRHPSTSLHLSLHLQAVRAPLRKTQELMKVPSSCRVPYAPSACSTLHSQRASAPPGPKHAQPAPTSPQLPPRPTSPSTP